MDAAELKAYERFKDEAQTLRLHCRDLEQELRVCGPELYRAHQHIDRLKQDLRRYRDENKLLKQKLADLTARLKQKPKPTPAFVKANVPQSKRSRTPGRKKGHAAALRPMPEKIDVHEQVAAPIDNFGHPCCPDCRSRLSDVQHHERIVEDIIPQQVLVTCYHTTSGFCPHCRKSVESRAQNQPPAADLPHAQLGLNALSYAMMMRVCYRLPLRQISSLFLQLPGLKISPAALVKQIQRVAKWLEKQYQGLKLVIRAAGVVHADETGWRTNGKNGYLWTLTTADSKPCTLYHVDRSRGAKVIVELLGKAFGHDGQTLVSDFYSVYDCFDAAQQKCLTHLLRELRDTLARRPELAEHEFFKRCKKLIQDMLGLKKRRTKLKVAQYHHQVQLVEKRLEALSRRQWDDADADRLSGRLSKYRTRLTTFLHKKEVDGTNNAAERAIRPAVVMRKITGGSRSEAGAKAWAILASVMRTAQQQGKNVLETIKTLLQAEWAGKDIMLLTDTS
ncbi:MAG TPA: IS66 family transposase [Candidatus Paceibacterota bacterium]|nr:IS66 family transposase [Candidatus Paceibacterota bacterium]